MKKVLNCEDGLHIPIKMWLDDIEEDTLDQAIHLSTLPFAFKHIALMPDCHKGYGMPIGGVLATKDVIVPNAVGVDIGCGMCAVKTSLTQISTETLKMIMGEIRKQIPLGMNRHKEIQDLKLMPLSDIYMFEPSSEKYPIVNREFSNALHQIGTLGGGNHFIEIQKGSDDHIWIMIHSGSRNLGLKVAEHYNQLAYNLNKKWFSNTYLPSNPKDSLAFLPVDSNEGQAYLQEMQYCVDFALANRKLMMDRIKNIFEYVIWNNRLDPPEDIVTFSDFENQDDVDALINIAHNYASLENHFKENVWVHRKGATLAREGTIGIIPGSQGTKSYIVKGLGNPDSFMSCSHGAGRKIGRKEATRTLNLKEEIKKLDNLGVVHGIRNQKDLEEAPSAYKDIDEVMINQQDLVKILIELKPLAVIKG